MCPEGTDSQATNLFMDESSSPSTCVTPVLNYKCSLCLAREACYSPSTTTNIIISISQTYPKNNLQLRIVMTGRNQHQCQFLNHFYYNLL